MQVNHIHFLATPEYADSISRATNVIGVRYACYFVKSYKRTGTVWEGRHKSSLVQTDCYFLTCCRYIEMNPVVACMVRKPDEGRWSSYRVNIWGAHSGLTQHDEYLVPGENSEGRCHACRELFRYEIPKEDVHRIQRAGQYCHPIGDDRFEQQIEQRYGIKLGQAARGRPIKHKENG